MARVEDEQAPTGIPLISVEVERRNVQFSDQPPVLVSVRPRVAEGTAIAFRHSPPTSIVALMIVPHEQSMPRSVDAAGPKPNVAAVHLGGGSGGLTVSPDAVVVAMPLIDTAVHDDPETLKVFGGRAVSAQRRHGGVGAIAYTRERNNRAARVRIAAAVPRLLAEESLEAANGATTLSNLVRTRAPQDHVDAGLIARDEAERRPLLDRGPDLESAGMDPISRRAQTPPDPDRVVVDPPPPVSRATMTITPASPAGRRIRSLLASRERLHRVTAFITAASLCRGRESDPHLDRDHEAIERVPSRYRAGGIQ